MDSESQLRRLEREKKARKEAEKLLETKSLELYKANLKLSQQTDVLEAMVEERTEHLQRALHEARSASRVKRQFISNISHELRTPLNGVLGTLQLLNERPLDSAQNKLVNQAVLSAERLKVLISDMLDMSKLESGAVQLDEYEFNIGSMLRELVDSFKEHAVAKSIDIHLNGMANSDLHVIADPVRFRQILFSLFDNAIKFTDRGAITINVGVKDVTTGKLTLFVSVADTGVGIAADKIEAIFENFTQVDDAASRKFQGAGLGLATSSQLLQMMNSRLQVQSTPGDGSIFWFRLPVKHELSAVSSVEGCRVLMAAPYDGDRTFTVKDLAKAGIDLTVVNDSQELLDRLRDDSANFDAVLLDERISERDKNWLDAHYPDYWRQRTVLLCLSKQHALKQAIHNCFVSLLETPLETQHLAALLSLLNEAGEVWDEPSIEPALSVVSSAVVEQDEFDEPQALVEENACWRGKVLLVEDNSVNALIAIEMLKLQGIGFSWVMDGSEAIKALQKDNFELVLMDCQMPVMDGYEATRRIRAGEAGDSVCMIPIIALTADNPTQGLQSFLSCDMNGWIAKPLEYSRLLVELKKHLLRADYAAEFSFDTRLACYPSLAVALLTQWQQSIGTMLQENYLSDSNQDILSLLAEISSALDLPEVLDKLRDATSTTQDMSTYKKTVIAASTEVLQLIKSKLHAMQEVTR